MIKFSCGHPYDDDNRKPSGKNRNGKPAFRCRVCHNKRMRESNKKNMPRVIARNKKYRERNREKVIQWQRGYHERNKRKLAYKWRIKHGWNPLAAMMRPLKQMSRRAI